MGQGTVGDGGEGRGDWELQVDVQAKGTWERGGKAGEGGDLCLLDAFWMRSSELVCAKRSCLS